MAKSNEMAESNSEPQSVTPAPIHGDILDSILSHLPLIHLVPASFVSKSWSSAVYSSSSLRAKPQPWLLVYNQGSRSPHTTTTYAYDPATNVWITIKQPAFNYVGPLRSTNSNFIYMISSSAFLFSFDPLHLNWHHATAPTVSRIDPVVALVGHQVVVAGGAYDFEYYPLAVEIYDIRTCKWTAGEPMPASLTTSASALWLSTAVNGNKLYLTEKQSNQGVTYALDLDTYSWLGPYNLLPDPIILNSTTGFINGRLILIALIADIEGDNTVKVWEVNSETFKCKTVGEMPAMFIEILKGNDFQISSIEIRLAGNFVYIYKPNGVSNIREVVTCEFTDDGGGCRWGSVRNKVWNEENFMDRFVLGCSEVRIEELQEAMLSGNCSFKVEL